MAKACAYLCHQCCCIDGFGEFGEFSGGAARFPQKVDHLLLVVALSTHTKTAKLTTATLQHSLT